MSPENISLPSTSKPGDDWRTVDDKKLRKKIQDRLAQRARRRRIAESKQQQAEPTSPQEQNATTQVSMELIAAVAPSNLLSTSEYHLLPRQFMSALTALFNNGIVLGMPVTQSCSMGVALPNSSVPESLQPTNLQLTVIHYTTVDRFPFPAFRNNLILMQDHIDPQEFLYDIINMHSFWVVDGRPSWDQTAWRMGRDYARKWGYLFLGDGKPPTTSAPMTSMSYTYSPAATTRV